MSFDMLFFSLRRIKIMIRLVINYLSKIIYHNITPSADYDAITPTAMPRKFSLDELILCVVPEVGLEPTWALSPPDFESGAYTNFATPAWNFR